QAQGVAELVEDDPPKFRIIEVRVIRVEYQVHRRAPGSRIGLQKALVSLDVDTRLLHDVDGNVGTGSAPQLQVDFSALTSDRREPLDLVADFVGPGARGIR